MRSLLNEVITAKEAKRIAVIVKKNNFQAVVEQVMENAYNVIRTASCIGFFNTTLDLGSFNLIRKMTQTGEVRGIVIKTLKDKGYLIKIKNKWILQISWGE